MEKLTTQQEKVINQLLHNSQSKEFTQFILETIGKDNWTRGVLSNCTEYLTKDQWLLYESLGGGYSFDEIEEDLYNVEIDFEISEQLKEIGVTRYLYENEEYIEEIRTGTIICEGINVEEIKKNLKISQNVL